MGSISRFFPSCLVKYTKHALMLLGLLSSLKIALLINVGDENAVLHRPSGPYPTSEFEHSSIPATVKKIFNLKEFLTKRDAWAGTFETVLNRTTPRTDCPGTF